MSPAEPRLRGVLVTFRRPAQLATMLTAVAAQTRQLDDLVVVDNEPTPETRHLVHRGAPAAEYIPSRENFGPAGGIAIGMRRLHKRAADNDWIMTIDDDDPPRDPTTFANLLKFACEMSE